MRIKNGLPTDWMSWLRTRWHGRQVAAGRLYPNRRSIAHNLTTHRPFQVLEIMLAAVVGLTACSTTTAPTPPPSQSSAVQSQRSPNPEVAALSTTVASQATSIAAMKGAPTATVGRTSRQSNQQCPPDLEVPSSVNCGWRTEIKQLLLDYHFTLAQICTPGIVRPTQEEHTAMLLRYATRKHAEYIAKYSSDPKMAFAVCKDIQITKFVEFRSEPDNLIAVITMTYETTLASGMLFGNRIEKGATGREPKITWIEYTDTAMYVVDEQRR